MKVILPPNRKQRGIIMYDKDLCDITWDCESQLWIVWYDGVLLGATEDFAEANEIVINYVTR